MNPSQPETPVAPCRCGHTHSQHFRPTGVCLYCDCIGFHAEAPVAGVEQAIKLLQNEAEIIAGEFGNETAKRIRVPLATLTARVAELEAERDTLQASRNRKVHIINELTADLSTARAENKSLLARVVELGGKTDAATIELRDARAELQSALGAKRHMDACRALLNAPDDDVLYSSIEEVIAKRDIAELKLSEAERELQSAKEHCDWLLNQVNSGRAMLNATSCDEMLPDAIRRTQAAANAEIERLRQAVSSAANVFRSYVAIHHLKHTPEGDEKAKSNATMAALMELALAGQGSKS